MLSDASPCCSGAGEARGRAGLLALTDWFPRASVSRAALGRALAPLPAVAARRALSETARSLPETQPADIIHASHGLAKMTTSYGCCVNG